jgi:hypothetical protein
MSQLAPLLRQITKKASHPNGLLYGMQLERARVKYLVRGELEDGKAAIELVVPEESGAGLKKEDEVELGEKLDGEGDGVKEGKDGGRGGKEG